MKRLLFLVSLFITMAAGAQVYTPSLENGMNLSPAVINKSLDARSYYRAVNGKKSPFISRAEILSYFDIPDKRVGNFWIVLRSGGSRAFGVVTGGRDSLLMFMNGTDDTCLKNVFTWLSVPGGGGGGGATDTSHLSDRIDANTALINGKLGKADSSGVSGFTSRGRLQKVIDSVLSLLNAGPAAPQIIGPIYAKNTWANNTGFVPLYGASAPTIVGSRLQVVSNTNVYNSGESIGIGGKHCYENWREVVRFRPQTTKSASTHGLGVGPTSTAANYVTSIAAWVDLSSNGTYGAKLNIANATDIYASSIETLAYSVNDSLETTIERRGNIIWATARNITTRSATIRASYVFGSEYGNAPVNLPNTGYMGVFPMGGTVLVDSISIVILEPRNPDIVVVGDSKFVGYNANWNYTTVNQLRSYFTNIVNVSGGGNRTVDGYDLKDDVIALNPKQVVLELGSNDGPDSASVKLYYKKFVDTMHAHGIAVWHIEPLYHSVLAMEWRRNWIKRTFSPDSIIYGTYEALKQPGALSPDNLHATNYGDSLIASAIMGSGKLIGGRNYTDVTGASVLLDGLSKPNSIWYWGGARVKKDSRQGSAIDYIKLGLPGETTRFGDANSTYAAVTFDEPSQIARLTGYNGNNAIGLAGTDLYHVGGGSILTTAYKFLGTTAFMTSASVDNSITFGSSPGGLNKAKLTEIGLIVGISAGQETSSAFQVASTTQGSMPFPVMTTTQRNAIAAPVAGLHVYDATFKRPYFHNGTTWSTFLTSAPSNTGAGNVDGFLYAPSLSSTFNNAVLRGLVIAPDFFSTHTGVDSVALEIARGTLRLKGVKVGGSGDSILVKASTGDVKMIAQASISGGIDSAAFNDLFDERYAALPGDTADTYPNAESPKFITSGGVVDYARGGNYIFTITNGANVTSSTFTVGRYTKVGNTVIYSGRLSVTLTAAYTNSVVSITIPIASDFTTADDCTGSMGSKDSGLSGTGVSNASTNKIDLQFLSNTLSGAMSIDFNLVYEIK